MKFWHIFNRIKASESRVYAFFFDIFLVSVYCAKKFMKENMRDPCIMLVIWNMCCIINVNSLSSFILMRDDSIPCDFQKAIIEKYNTVRVFSEHLCISCFKSACWLLLCCCVNWTAEMIQRIKELLYTFFISKSGFGAGSELAGNIPNKK